MCWDHLGGEHGHTRLAAVTFFNAMRQLEPDSAEETAALEGFRELQ